MAACSELGVPLVRSTMTDGEEKQDMEKGVVAIKYVLIEQNLLEVQKC
jgi:hypothetical protein